MEPFYGMNIGTGKFKEGQISVQDKPGLSKFVINTKIKRKY